MLMYSCTLKQSPKETVVEKESILELMCRKQYYKAGGVQAHHRV